MSPSHYIKSHNFFQSQQLWSSGSLPDRIHYYYTKQRRMNNNVQMDDMMKHSLDCLSAISGFMTSNAEFIGINYDNLKAKTFWETIKSISQFNINILKNDNQITETAEMNAIEILLANQISIKPIQQQGSDKNESDWNEILWSTINYNSFSKLEYDQLLNNNMESIINTCGNKPREKLSIGHLLAISDKNNFEFVVSMFNRFPSLARQEDAERSLPLHYAARYCGDKSLLQFFIQQYPKAMMTKDNQGQIPIHLSIYNDNIDIFITLLHVCKESILEQNNKSNNNNLLHLLANKNDYKKLKSVIDICPESARVLNLENRYPLNIASLNNNSDIVSLLIDTYKEALQDRRIYVGIDQCNIPLVAAARYSTVKIFQLLYNSFPEGINWTSERKLSVLIEAAHYNNDEMIVYIAKSFPHLAKQRDNTYNKLPLHIVLQKYVDKEFTFDVIKELYNAYPEAITKRDINQNVPIQYFLAFNDDLEFRKIIELLITDYPESLNLTLKDGRGLSLYNNLKTISVDVHRLLSRIGKEKTHLEDFKELNYQARRMAMFLAFVGVAQDAKLNIWRNLKLQNNMELLRYTITFL